MKKQEQVIAAISNYFDTEPFVVRDLPPELELLSIENKIELVFACKTKALVIKDCKFEKVEFVEGFESSGHVSIQNCQIGEITFSGYPNLKFFDLNLCQVGKVKVLSGSFEQFEIATNIIGEILVRREVVVEDKLTIDNFNFEVRHYPDQNFPEKDGDVDHTIESVALSLAIYQKLTLRGLKAKALEISDGIPEGAIFELFYISTHFLRLNGLANRSKYSSIEKLTFLLPPNDSKRKYSLEISACQLNEMIWKDFKLEKATENDEEKSGELRALIRESSISDVNLINCELPNELASEEITENQLGYRQLKLLAQNHGKYSFSSQYYRMEMAAYVKSELKRMTLDSGLFKKIRRFWEWFFVIYLNHLISRFGQKFLRPLVLLLIIHLSMTVWMYFDLNNEIHLDWESWKIILDVDFWNIYAVTILPTHKLKFLNFEFSPIISLIMRILNSVLIYHILRGSRRLMNR